MKPKTSRREFLQNATLSTFAIVVGTRTAARTGGIATAYAANETVLAGVVGVNHRGAENLRSVAEVAKIAALCDVDDRFLADAAKQHAGAKTFHDFRKLIDLKEIDAVVCSTPDHTHAPVTAAALRAGKHVYCEKPLCHSVHEVRKVRELAREAKKATQMGTQIHAGDNYRRVVEMVQAGAIGPVSECHVWCGKNWGGGERPKEMPAVPDYLHYDLWLGPAPKRPYHPTYLPAEWRRWWDFGGGTLADMGCHYIDLAFWSLELGYPTKVGARGSDVDPETCPLWLAVDWDFPARKTMPPVRLSWYDSGRQPELVKLGKVPAWDSAVLFVGAKGMLLADYGRHLLLPEKDFTGYVPPPQSIPASIGHHEEWIAACKDGRSTTCNFDYSGTLAEAVLLGNVAYRAGCTFEWDGEAFKASGCSEVEKYLRREYREGWTL